MPKLNLNDFPIIVQDYESNGIESHHIIESCSKRRPELEDRESGVKVQKSGGKKIRKKPVKSRGNFLV
jgi:hypothetical protein